MASVAESVARLTHPRSQTGFGRPKGRDWDDERFTTKDTTDTKVQTYFVRFDPLFLYGFLPLCPWCPLWLVLATDERRDRPVLHNRDPYPIAPAGLVAIDGKPAMLPDARETLQHVGRGFAVGVPARAVELDPHAVGPAWKRNRFDCGGTRTRARSRRARSRRADAALFHDRAARAGNDRGGQWRCPSAGRPGELTIGDAFVRSHAIAADRHIDDREWLPRRVRVDRHLAVHVDLGHHLPVEHPHFTRRQVQQAGDDDRLVVYLPRRGRRRHLRRRCLELQSLRASTCR